MYYYIYDSCAQSKEMSREVAKIESRLLDFGIKDKIAKIGPLKPVRDAVSEAYKQKFDAIIAVGEDPLVLSILNYIVGYPIVLGVIPLGKQVSIGRLLSMPIGFHACEIISARKIQEFSIAKADHEYFFSSFNISRGVSSLLLDNKYSVSVPIHSSISIVNIGTPPKQFGITKENKQDGKFTVSLLNETKSFFGKTNKEISIWRAALIELTSEKDFVAVLDGVEMKKPIVSIQNIERAVKCIVGKTKPY